MFRPLAGIRVIDLTQVLAGPFATYQLALLGAEVIKIEQPGTGDWTRSGAAPAGLEGQGMGTAFLTQNADKMSVVLDLKDPAGLGAALELVRTADVFVENFRPGTAGRLGLSFDEVAAVKPDIVYCSLSAYGQDGPIGHRPAYDHVVQGMCGIMRLTGTPETEPNKVGAPYIDYATGMNGALAIVAALHEVRRTGTAVRLDVAMLDSALMLMASLITNHLNTGWLPAASGNEAWSGSPSSGAFATRDGTLMIAANTERQFRALCRALELQDILEEERFADPVARKDNLDALRSLISDTLLTRPADHWEAVLDRAGVPAARVRSLDEVLAEPQTATRGIARPIEVPGADSPMLLPSLGFKANGATVGPTSPPPRLGADTARLTAPCGAGVQAADD